jgi:hypothetical protein
VSIEVNGIAHIQLTVSRPDVCLPFWEQLCHFMEMKTLIKSEEVLYCIGSRTGILVRGAPMENRDIRFNQDVAGLHHFCFRAKSVADVDGIHEFVVEQLKAKIIHGPQQDAFAPGYYSTLFEDPEGIRVEVNHVPGQGHFGGEGRLADGGKGPANIFNEDGLLDQ